MEKEKLSLKVYTIIILFIHFKRIIYICRLSPSKTPIYTKKLSRQIHQFITWSDTWPLVFDSSKRFSFKESSPCSKEKERYCQSIILFKDSLRRRENPFVRGNIYIYICKKVHIVMKNKTLTILFIYKICMIPAKITLQYPFYFVIFSPNYLYRRFFY